MMTARKKQIIEEYFVDFNQTKAAIRAGYSIKTARSMGSRLFADVDIVIGIKALSKKLMAEIKADQIQTVIQLKQIAYSDVWDIKVSDKISALEKLAKIQGILGDTNINLSGDEAGIMYYPVKLPVGAPVDMKLIEAGDNGGNGEDVPE